MKCNRIIVFLPTGGNALPFSKYLDCLAQEFRHSGPIEHGPVTHDDPFLAISALQKSLRRGDAGYAHRAALTLLRVDPSKFWRRLVISVCEDFGLSDLSVTVQIIAASSDKAWRKRVGGDQRVACHLIDKLVERPRDRRTDELYMLAVALSGRSDPVWALENLRLSSGLIQPVREAVTLVKECETVVPFRGRRAIVAEHCDRAIARMAYQGWAERELEAACMQARRTSQCCLPVFLPLVNGLMPVPPGNMTVVMNTPPEFRDLLGLPSYAFDGYTRTGRTALTILVRKNAELAEIVSPLLSAKDRMDALTNLLFAVEGGVCTTESSDPLYDELKQFSRGCWSGLSIQSLSQGLKVMAAAVPELNAIRDELAH